MTIMSHRNGMKFETEIQSDCGSVAEICQKIIDTLGEDIKFMRDPTRGGIAATLNEIVNQTNCGIEIDENKIPVHPSTQAAADMLGFDILDIANEGKVVIVVSAEKADECLQICKQCKNAKDAAIIGRVIKSDEPLVELLTKIEARRIIQMPSGRELPRIC